MELLSNRDAIRDVITENAKYNKDILVLCSDSRGSSSMTDFFELFPKQSVEIGIAEQNLVSIAAGLAKCGKIPFCFSPASFLSTRSYEQIKIDVAYSKTNVKLIGVSGGVSYGALGMSHHSLQDIASIGALPGIDILIPSDAVNTRFLVNEMCCNKIATYMRVGRNPVRKIYKADFIFSYGKANIFDGDGVMVSDKYNWRKISATIIACGEMVANAIEAKRILGERNIEVTVIDMFSVAPIDEMAVINASMHSDILFTLEEHVAHGGLGSIVTQIICTHCPKKVINVALPNAEIIAGKSEEVFKYYGMDAESLAERIEKELLYL